jgi:hypothetical protein
LAAGEIGFETDNNRFKIGNGATAWTALDYFANSAALTALLDGAPEALDTLNELAAAIGDDADFITTISNTISNHTNATTSVHGIADTSLLATTSQVETASTNLSADLDNHNDATENVHGIADTSALATTEYVDSALSNITGDYSLLAGVGLAWNADTEALDVDETIATVGSVTDHASATTDVHGIADTAALATTADTATAIGTAVSDHNDLTLSVHGIADTSALALSATVATDISTAVSGHNDETTNIHGIADTSLLATTADVAAVTKTTLGLGNVDNTSDADKPVSTATVTAIATAKSEAIAEVTAVIDGAPNALNTLNELAAALGDDENFAGTVTTSLAAKVDSYTPITQKTESYTLSTLDHRDDLIEMGSASALTLTIPLNSSIAYPVGTSMDILQTGAGQVTIAGAAGVTVNATPGLKLRTQWSSATLFKRAENTWVVYGDLTA